MTDKQNEILNIAYKLFGTMRVNRKIVAIKEVIKAQPDIEYIKHDKDKVRELLSEIVYN